MPLNRSKIVRELRDLDSQMLNAISVLTKSVLTSGLVSHPASTLISNLTSVRARIHLQITYQTSVSVSERNAVRNAIMEQLSTSPISQVEFERDVRCPDLLLREGVLEYEKALKIGVGVTSIANELSEDL